MKKKVVVLGGGNGSAKSIGACKTFIDRIELSAVISVSDSGGSSGRLRDEYDILPPGDILRAVMAMSQYPYDILKSIFYKSRFENVGVLDGHNVGNLFLVFAAQYAGGDFVSAIRALEQSLSARGRVYPATLGDTHLVAELANGEIIRTEALIDRPVYDRSLKIRKLWLEPEVRIYEDAERVIREADYIVMGPGSLYCSVVAALLPSGFREAIKKSSARLVYVVGNAFECDGETGPGHLSGFVAGLQQYLPRPIDMVVYNNHIISDEEQAGYTRKNWALFEADFENVKDSELIQGDYERLGKIGLDDKKLGAILDRLLI
ncbi:MAG: uridine diphosphate-N-acetylglucosamine-binding protein YvcK [Candidatus Magasanikbacteria bacterium]|nr:uridine diphosphate-N-acetylglucosamine-binding protein YvcK [Candidatus Magasanikbacteria bacterium]